VDALAASPDVELAAALGHDEALAWAGDWGDVDVLVVDAADEGRAADQFPGVAVVRRARAAGGPGRPLIVVVTGHYLHDGLRHRMKAAGADFYFLRSDLRSPESLLDVVLRPDRYRRGVPAVGDPHRRQVLGVGPDADVEAFVALVESEGLGTVLDGGDGSRQRPRARRWSRLRREARTRGVEAVNMTTGNPPQGQESPSIRQLGRLWQWAARIRRPGDS
jgi:CheY-like chemotaxis protein